MRRSPKKYRSSICKKTSSCVCKGARCTLKPYKCRSITKCSKGIKYNIELIFFLTYNTG